jgi:hypothetical protein
VRRAGRRPAEGGRTPQNDNKKSLLKQQAFLNLPVKPGNKKP